MTCKKWAVTTLLTAISLSSYAQDKVQDDLGWYVGGYVGNLRSDLKTVGTKKSSNSSLGAFGGYNFTPWFGLESSLWGGEADTDKNANMRSAGFGGTSITPKFTYAINDTASLYIKAGLATLVYSEKYKSNRRNSNDNTDNWGGTGSTVGVGAEFRIHNGLKLRISYDQYKATLEDKDDYYADKRAKLFQTGVGMYYQF